MSIETYPKSEIVRGEPDRRICPPEHQVDFVGDAFGTEEVTEMNHAQGILGDFVIGPEQVKVVIGTRTLGYLSELEKAIREDESALSADVRHLKYRFVDDIEAKLRPELDKARFEGRHQDMLPTIFEHCALEVPLEDGVIEDLGKLATSRAALREAIREVAVTRLRLELEVFAGGLMFMKRDHDVEFVVEGEEHRGKLLDVGTGSSGKMHADLLLNDGSRKRVDLSAGYSMGVAIPPEAIEESLQEVSDPSQEWTEVSVDEVEVVRGGLFSRFRRR